MAIVAAAASEASAVSQGGRAEVPESKSEQDFSTRAVLRRILPAAGGSFVEWYEYAIYVYLADYISINFFPGRGNLGTWAGLAITCLCRPLGGALFGHIADTFGRKPAMQLSISLMLFCTVSQGCLPTFTCCGEAWGQAGLVMLLVLRALQGLSAGGELSTAAVYITEASPRESLGYYLSWISVTGAFGSWIVASFVISLLETCLSPAAMSSWGWRSVYLTTLIPGALLAMSRRRMEETKDFEEVQREASLKATGPGQQEDPGLEEGAAEVCSKTASTGEVGPLREVLREHKLALLVGTLGSASVGAVWYVIPLSLYDIDGLPENMVTLSQGVLNMVAVVLAPFVGMLVDAQGVGRVYLSAVVLGSLLMPVPLMYWWAHTPPQHALAAVFIGQGILGLNFALSTSVYLWTVELFPARVRSTGVGMCYNLGVGIFGGLGPMLAELGSKVISPRGLVSAPAAFVLFSGSLSLIALAAGHLLARRGLMRLTHIRSSPY